MSDSNEHVTMEVYLDPVSGISFHRAGSAEAPNPRGTYADENSPDDDRSERTTENCYDFGAVETFSEPQDGDDFEEQVAIQLRNSPENNNILVLKGKEAEKARLSVGGEFAKNQAVRVLFFGPGEPCRVIPRDYSG